MATNKASVLDVDNMMGVLHRRCGNHGVTLEWSKNAQTAATDGQKIVLPIPKYPITNAAMERLYGFVIHECGHHTRPEAFDILNAAKPPDAVCGIFNILEDEGMERDVAMAHAGDAKTLGIQNATLLDEIVAKWGKDASCWPENPTEQDVAPISVHALTQLSRMDWDAYSNANRHNFMNNLHPVAKGLVDDLINEGWADKVSNTSTPKETWNTTIDLVKRLYPQADDDQMEELREQGNKAADGDTEDGEQDGTGDNGDTDAVESGTDGQPTGGSAGDALTDAEGKLPGEGTVIHWKEAVASQHDEWKPKDPNQRPGNIGIDWSDYKKGKVGFMPPNEINVVDCQQKKGLVTYDWCSTSAEDYMSDNAQSRAFAANIRRYIQAKDRVQFDGEKKHGRLDKRGIVRLAMPPIDGGEWNKKIFYDMKEHDALNTCIHVLTDWSGSMDGRKMKHAADASGRLVAVFDRVLRVPVQLAAFTNGQSRCDIGLIKPFSRRNISPIDIAQGFANFYPYSSGNNDSDAVLWAWREIMKRPEQRKILIVLSDGAPTCAYYGSSSSNLKYVCNEIEQAGDVELYGVGINSEAVKGYYSNYKVLHDTHDINPTLMNIIKEGVK